MKYAMTRVLWLGPLVALVGITLGATATAVLANDEEWDPDKELLRIQEMIEENGWNWVAGPSETWHYTPEQKQRMHGTLPTPEDYKRPAPATGDVVPLADRDIPAFWDWRELGGMTVAKHQGDCGSCWAFAATSTFEAMIKIYKGQDKDLSEQQIVSCNEVGHGCDGGWPETGYRIQMTMGQIRETGMPYGADDTIPCNDYNQSTQERHQGWVDVPNTPNSLKTAVMNGPITVNLHAPNALHAYDGGCFEWDEYGQVNHSVCLCGWDDTGCEGQGAWLIKNSWGQSWGEVGFAWIRYGDLQLGSGATQILYTPSIDARLGYNAVEVLGGDGNGSFDPGETANLRVTLRNFGRVTATNIAATLASTDPDVTVTNATASFPTTWVWGLSPSDAPDFEVSASPDAEGAIEMVLTISCEQADQDQESRFTLFIGPTETIYEEGFEDGMSGWTHGGTFDDWQCATLSYLYWKPDPYYACTGDVCLGTDLNDGMDILYESYADNWAQSPVIDCTGKEGVHLGFRRWLTVEEGIYDDAMMFVNGVQLFANPSNELFFDTRWEDIVYDISAIADNNPSVQLRFELDVDSNLEYGGWGIDDVRIFAPGEEVVDDVPDIGSAPVALSLRPMSNPFRPGASILLAIPAPGGQPDVSIVDLSGRCVRTLDTGGLSIGFHPLIWNGRDDAGRPMPVGVYFLRAILGDCRTSSRLVMIR